MKKQSEINQLHRIKGQLNGIEKMFKNKAAASAILQQLEAACGSLRSLEKKFLEEESKKTKNADLKNCLNYLLKCLK